MALPLALGAMLGLAATMHSAIAPAQTHGPAQDPSSHDDIKQRARAEATAGRQAFDAGDYSKAVQRFQQANRLVDAPPHWLYLARAHRRMGKLHRAIELYRHLNDITLDANAPAPFVEAQQSARAELKDLLTKVPRITIVLSGPGSTKARVFINNVEVSPEQVGKPITQDPGLYRIRAMSVLGGTEQAELTLVEGANQTVSLTFSGEPGPLFAENQNTPQTAEAPETAVTSSGVSPLLVGGIIGTGLGAVGLGVGSYFFMKSRSTKSDADDLFDRCNPRECTDEERQKISQWDKDAKNQQTIGTVGLIGGGVLAAGGLTLVLIAVSSGSGNSSPAAAPKDAKASNAPGTLQPWVGLHSLGVRGTF